MDPSLVKGHFFMGQALFESENYDEAVKHLQRAFDLAREQKLNFGDDISSMLRSARKKRFTLLEEKRIAQEIELQSYINKLMADDKEKQLKELDQEGLDADFRVHKAQEIKHKCVCINLKSFF